MKIVKSSIKSRLCRIFLAALFAGFELFFVADLSALEIENQEAMGLKDKIGPDLDGLAANNFVFDPEKSMSNSKEIAPEILQTIQQTANLPSSTQTNQELYQSSSKLEQNPALVYQGTPQRGDADYSAISPKTFDSKPGLNQENQPQNSSKDSSLNFPALSLPKDSFQNYSSRLYNQELQFNENKKLLTLPEFRDIDGRLTPRYSEKKLSIYDPRKPTPSRFFSADLSMPEVFSPTNNLAKKTGAFYRAYGEVIFIQGTVTDSFLVPIQNAVVEIWQTNSAGKYHSLLEPSSEFIDPFFNMSGRAITDNLGNYHFISIMPGSSAGRAPHINFNIYHPRFGKLETEMYFENHPYNKDDSQYLAYNESERKFLTAYVSNTDIFNPRSIKIFTFNIVMRGVHQYKKF